MVWDFVSEKMDILTLSEMFPSFERPNYGIFVFELLRHTVACVNHQVVAPVGVWPFIWRCFCGRFRYAPNGTAEEELPFAKVFRPKYMYLPCRTLHSLWGYSYYAAIRPYVRPLRFDLIHAHQPFPDGFAGMLLKRMTGKPLVVTVHGDVLVKRIIGSPVLRSLTRRVFAAADAIIVVANYQHELCRFLGVSDQSKVFNIPNGVDVEAFQLKQDQRAVRQRLGLPTDKKILLFLGNLYAPKGLPVLLDSLIHLCKMANAPAFNFVLVGDGPLKQQLEAQVARQNLSDIVRFVGDQPHDNVPLWLSAADVMVLPSLQEGFPTVIPEALAAGRPVVSTSVGGIPDVISSAKFGLLVEPGNSMALAMSLRKALIKKWNHEAIAEHGAKYSWGEIGRKTCEVYRKTARMAI